MEREQPKQKARKSHPRKSDSAPQPESHSSDDKTVSALQKKIGNRAVQRLIAQRSSNAPACIDDQVSQRINQARSGGEALHPELQTQMGRGLSADFSQVRVHTSQESDGLNQALGAKAFTTGKDIFFKQGAYDPHSSSGKELIAHELTHVVQQGSGQVEHSSSGMSVNPPGDVFEQQADQAAKKLAQTNPLGGIGQTKATQVQRDLEPGIAALQRQEEEEEVQLQEDEEEEEIQMQVEEEEEDVQAKRGGE